jgi:hypothetical protein
MAGCREEFDDSVERCPRCRSSAYAVEDRSSRLPAMLTLTYPGDWLTVAPSAEAAMGHFQALCKRYARTWGEPLRGPWKKEFQGRGAVHFHISTTPPMGTTTVLDPTTGKPVQVDFKRWLSLAWADIVAHPNPEERRRHLLAGTGVDYAQGLRLTDPRRMSIYFGKYGSAATGKEHQHRVPGEWLDTVFICGNCADEFDQALDECPACGHPDGGTVTRASVGRFWGYRGLQPLLAVREVAPAVGIAAGRIARRWYRAKGLTRQTSVRRIRQSSGQVSFRRSRVRTELFSHGRGFICVNDAAGFASAIARYLTTA